MVKKNFAQVVQDIAESGSPKEAGCVHFEEIQDVVPSADGCEDCLKIGDRWVHLRLCMTCGHVGCCEDSKNQHAKKHVHETGHPIVMSFEPGEEWLWCYDDDSLMTNW